MLINYPILKYPNFKEKFTLTTDASNKAIGAILSQKGHPISYASRTLNVHERNYSTIEKELLAIVWATKYFRPYLYGVKFEIKTDHRPLVWLQSLKDPDSKTLRWRIKLNEYNFNISYVKGKENQVADFLSRINTDQNEINYQNKIPSDIATIHSGKEELNDHIHIREGIVNTCKHQIILVKEKQKELKTVHKNRHIYIDEIDLNSENLTTEILKRNLPEKGKIGIYSELPYSIYNKLQILIVKLFSNNLKLHFIKYSKRAIDLLDQEQTLKIIKTEHEENKHLGVNKTYENLKGKYYFPKLEKLINEYIDNCETCGKTKYDRKPYKIQFEISETPNDVNEIVIMDIYMTKNKNYFTTFDKFSKYLHIKYTLDKNPITLIKLIQEYITTFGKPKKVIFDNAFDVISITQFLKEFKVENFEYNLNINISELHPHNLIYQKILTDIQTFYIKLSINNQNKYWRSLDSSLSFISATKNLQIDEMEIIKLTLVDPEKSIPMNTTLHILGQLNEEFHLGLNTAIKLMEDHYDKGHIGCIKKNIFKFINMFPYNCNICKLIMSFHIDIIVNNVWDKLRSLYNVSAGFAVDNEIGLLLPKKYENLIANILEIEAESILHSFREGGNKNSKITDGILFMICRDSELISVVENEGFQYLMKLVAPLYKIPSRRTFDELLDKKYEFVSNMLKEKLSGIQYICLTTDVWTETHQTSFLGVTAHYVSNDTDDLKLQGVTLGVYELEERHTGENLAQKLKEICTKWNIKDDVVIAVVTDGGSNMIKAVELAFDKKRHTYCFAHLLNLLAQKSIESLPQLKSLLEQVKTIVSWFRSSVIGSDELRKRTVNSTEKTLIQSVSTRWNSTYYMVERFLALREIVSSIINFNTTAPPMITAKDVEFVQDFVLLFKPIEVATKEACGEKFVTSSMIIPILFATATILDPRFKNLHFDDKAALGSVIRKLSNELRKDLIESESDSDAPSHSSGSKENEYSLWDDHHKMVQEAWKSRKKSRIVEELDTPNSIPPEFSVYLKQPVVRLKDSPFEVWTEIVHKVVNNMNRTTRRECNIAKKQRQYQKHTIELLKDNLKRGTVAKLTSFRSITLTHNKYNNNKHRETVKDIWSNYTKHIYNTLDYLGIEHKKLSIPKSHLYHEKCLREFKVENLEYNLNINISELHPHNLIYQKILTDIQTFYIKLSINNQNKYWRSLDSSLSFISATKKLQIDEMEIIKLTLVDPENSIPMNTTLYILGQLNEEFHLGLNTAIKLMEDHYGKGHIGCIKKNIFKFINVLCLKFKTKNIVSEIKVKQSTELPSPVPTSSSSSKSDPEPPTSIPTSDPRSATTKVRFNDIRFF
ncbi:unnamed protein product [Hermetia illucens]|uniref:RNA-directed DNA polymerase n=1 Tax=Hermetia illucens TaxID=343691 RepID=A0A7R8UL17_HERIL|nr:unnamed protein product [Hermetia illucens]